MKRDVKFIEESDMSLIIRDKRVWNYLDCLDIMAGAVGKPGKVYCSVLREKFLEIFAPGLEEKVKALDRLISDGNFSVRVRRGLERLGIVTYRNLVEISEAKLLSYRNFGRGSLNEIKGKLSEYGLSLRDDES